MEAIVATAGGILLVLSLGGAGGIASTWITIRGPVAQGDRGYSGVLGFVLVSLAALLEEGSSREATWAVLLLGAGIAALYARFLWKTRFDWSPRTTQPEEAPSQPPPPM